MITNCNTLYGLLLQAVALVWILDEYSDCLFHLWSFDLISASLLVARFLVILLISIFYHFFLSTSISTSISTFTSISTSTSTSTFMFFVACRSFLPSISICIRLFSSLTQLFFVSISVSRHLVHQPFSFRLLLAHHHVQIQCHRSHYQTSLCPHYLRHSLLNLHHQTCSNLQNILYVLPKMGLIITIFF